MRIVARFYFPFPLFPMLYRVRFQYGFDVEANGSAEAHKKAVEMLKHSPELAISTVEDASLARPKGVVERLVTGK
jgi:hypothetical protein